MPLRQLNNNSDAHPVPDSHVHPDATLAITMSLMKHPAADISSRFYFEANANSYHDLSLRASQ